MQVQMFNFWYFFFLLLCVGAGVGLYLLLRNRTEKTQKAVLFSLLLFGLVLHFLKCFFPPYSTDQARLYRDIFFINICGANIFLFPFLFFSKSNAVKDYMFYLGILGGGAAMLYPIEPLDKVDQAAEWLDVIRFYVHHAILWIVPLLMVLLGHHKLSWRRVWMVPHGLLLLFIFIMFNQIIQSELGFVPLRGDDIFAIGYKNTSFIWGPGDNPIGAILSHLCPNCFKVIPVGEYAGQVKYWPFVWMIFPVYALTLPLCFAISLIFDHKAFKADMVALFKKTSLFFSSKKVTSKEGGKEE